MAFAHRTGSRLGTAAIVARIIPVEYSPLMTNTPEDSDGELGGLDAGEVHLERMELLSVVQAHVRPVVRDNAAGERGQANDQE